MRILKLSIYIFISLFFTACFKDYICECEGGLGIQTHLLEKRSKAEAEEECARSHKNNIDPATGSGSCTLKER